MSSVETGEAPPIPAENIKRAFKWASDPHVVPPHIALAINASIWMSNVDALRNQEEMLMVEG